MKNTIAILSVAALTALSATTVAAAITQAEVLGESGHPVYTVKIRSTNGETFICKPELTSTADGRPARECKRDTAAGPPDGTGITGAAAGAAAGVGFLALVLSNNGNSSATTTTGSGN